MQTNKFTSYECLLTLEQKVHKIDHLGSFGLSVDWFKQYVNLSRFILCLEVQKSHSLYVHIYIVLCNFFVCTLSYQIQIISKQIYMTIGP